MRKDDGNMQVNSILDDKIGSNSNIAHFGRL